EPVGPGPQVSSRLGHGSPTWLFRPTVHIAGPYSPLNDPGTAGQPRQAASPGSHTRTRFFEASRRGHLARPGGRATGPEEKEGTKKSLPEVMIVVPQF